MPLLVNQLSTGLGFAFNTKSQNVQQWSKLIGDTIWSYTSTISPPSSGVTSGKATFVGTFVQQSYGLQSYLPRALTAALPPYAVQIAAGMFQFGYQGVPPSAPLPNFQGIFNSNRDKELTEAQCANNIAAAIHNWFASGIAINIATGISTPWTSQAVASELSGAGPAVPSFQLSAPQIAAHREIIEDLSESTPAIIPPTPINEDLANDEDIEIIIEERIKHELIIEDSEDVSVQVNYNQEEFKEFQDDQPLNVKEGGPLGERVVKEAYKYVGVAETNSKNYGGKYVAPSKKQINEYYFNGDNNGVLPTKRVDRARSSPGEIDQMLADAGRTSNYGWPRGGYNVNAKKPRPRISEGYGYSWCAAFVTRVWNDAGVCHPLYYGRDGRRQNDKANKRKPGVEGGGRFDDEGKGWNPSRCTSWEDWAKYHGIWLDKTECPAPSQGYAIVWYSKAKSRMCHIGIVVGVRKDGQVVTIEGNTGGKLKGDNLAQILENGGNAEKAEANGNAVYVKVANVKETEQDKFVAGYIKCLPDGAFPDDRGSSNGQTFPEASPSTSAKTG